MATACASSGNDASSDGDASTDGDYLGELEAALAPLHEGVGEIDERLSGTYTDRHARIDALSEVGIGARIESVVTSLGDIEPPAEHVDDHAAVVRAFMAALAHREDIERALENDDFLGIQLEALELRLLEATLAVDLDADVCQVVTATLTEALCVDEDALPAGDYGIAANRVARETAATVFPRTTAVDVGMDFAELTALLAVIQPVIEVELNEGRAELAALEPPESLRDAHEAVLTWFEDLADIAAQITAAAEASDRTQLNRLFDQSAGPGRMLGAALDDDGEAIFGVLVVR